MAHLCVAIFFHSSDQARRDIALAAELGADMIELRIDLMTSAEQIKSLVQAATLPCIITCRPTWEGGQSELDDEERLILLDAIALDEAACIDFEFKAYQELIERVPSLSKLIREEYRVRNSVAPIAAILQRIAHQPRNSRYGVILSAHDFIGRPDRLYNIVADLAASEADVQKIVWTARTIRDNLEAFDILRQRQKPTIALCMGEAGLISRVLAKKFGAFLTFAALDDGGGTAPGQVSVAQMKSLYRWDAIGPSTKVYGVIGSPIAHSMSPAIHNAAFDAIGFDGVYLPLLVNNGYESFKAFMESFLHAPGLDLSGLSITIPHKENALRYLRECGHDVQIDSLAASIGALNTIVIDYGADGKMILRGFSTDYAAILDCLTIKLSAVAKRNVGREDLKNYRIGILGAGGAARTAVAALAHYGATIILYNRTRARADALVAEFNGQSGKVVAADFENLCKSCCHIYINATSLGMHPNVAASPFGDTPPVLSNDTIVFDTVYNPIQTRLLSQAQAAGAQTINGVEMFVRQAAGQFEAWTNRSAPSGLMRQVVEGRLR